MSKVTQTFLFAGAFLLAWSCRTAAAPAKSGKPIPRGTAIVLVGVISSQPRDVRFTREKKLQVAVGPRQVDHTLHLDGARFVGMQGQDIALSDLRDKMWVRVEGHVMDDARRINVEGLRIIGRTWSQYRRSSYFGSGKERGYVTVTGGSGGRLASTKAFREGAQVMVLGEISSQPRSLRFKREGKMQVAVGAAKVDYTLHLDGAEMTNADGDKLGLNDLRDKMWVLAEGKVGEDSRRIEVRTLKMVGKTWREYRDGAHFDSSDERGFIRGM